MQTTRTTDHGVRVLTHLEMLPPGTRLTAAALARTLVRGPERALAEDSPSVAVEALIRIFALED